MKMNNVASSQHTSPAVMLDLLRAERERRSASASLYEFVQQAWPIVEPGVPFIGGWHIEQICEHLEACSQGDLKKLLINIPPRHSKSTIVSVDDIGGWEHLIIPAEWDGQRRSTSVGEYDPRTEMGELICPDRFGEKEIADLKKLLGQYSSAGQLQQEPSPAEGGILKTKYFNFWPADVGLPPFEYILQSYDCAFTEKSTGDPTACTVWAIFTHEGSRHVMLIDAWDEHLSYPNLREKAIKGWGTEYGGSKMDSPFTRNKRPDRILVEAKASGQSLLQDLRMANVPAIGYNPGNADKISRAHQAAPTLELGLCWIPESKKTPGHPVNWASGFIKQLAKFPVATHDDYVDTFTQAIIYFKNDGFFDLPVARDYDDPQLKVVVDNVNPYAA